MQCLQLSGELPARLCLIPCKARVYTNKCVYSCQLFFLPGGRHKTEKVHLFPFNGLYLVDIYLTGARFVSHTHLLYKSKCFHRPTFCHSTLSCCLGALRCVKFKNYISFLFSALQNIISSCEPEGVSEIQRRKKNE